MRKVARPLKDVLVLLVALVALVAVRATGGQQPKGES
jgi:hypothetical protein